MKYLALVFTISLFSTSSFALARVLALCSTQNGEYTISVTEKLGIINKQTQLVLAAIKDEQDNVVGAFYVEVVGGQTNNYGGVKYVDKLTGGEKFALEAPAPGQKEFRLRSPRGDQKLQCSAFNRQLPGR